MLLGRQGTSGVQTRSSHPLDRKCALREQCYDWLVRSQSNVTWFTIRDVLIVMTECRDANCLNIFVTEVTSDVEK